MQARWSVGLSDLAAIQRSRLTNPAKSEVNRLRRSLGEGPYALDNAIELLGHPGIWRIRLTVGNRRMIVRVVESEREIEILDILRRAEAYEKYPIPDEDPGT